MAINLDAGFLRTKALLSAMKASGWGCIINLSSSSVNNAPPMGEPYVASKAALVGLARTLAAEVGRFGITVNAIAPNPVRTPGASVPQSDAMFEAIAVMVAEDVTGTMAFLCGDRAAFITGQMHVNSGAIRAG